MFLLPKITLICSQIITLNTSFGQLIPFYEFKRIYIQIRLPQTLPDCTRGDGNFLIFWGILFLIEIMISNRNYKVVISLNCTRGNVNVFMI